MSAWLCSSAQNRPPSARPAPAELQAPGWRKDGVKRGCRCQKHQEGSARLAREVSPSPGRDPALRAPADQRRAAFTAKNSWRRKVVSALSSHQSQVTPTLSVCSKGCVEFTAEKSYKKCCSKLPCPGHAGYSSGSQPLRARNTISRRQSSSAGSGWRSVQNTLWNTTRTWRRKHRAPVGRWRPHPSRRLQRAFWKPTARIPVPGTSPAPQRIPK